MPTENLALFAGYFAGLMEVENKQGALDTASMVCPGMLEVHLLDGTQRGWGRCIIVTTGGDRIYAGWTCAAKHLEGCSGPFTIAGGTGKFRGLLPEHSAATVAAWLAQHPTITVSAAGARVGPIACSSGVRFERSAMHIPPGRSAAS